MFGFILEFGFIVHSFSEFRAGDGDPVADGGRGNAGPRFDLLIGEAVAGTEPQHIFLLRSEVDVWVFGPEAMLHGFFLFRRAGGKAVLLDGDFGHLIRQGLLAPDLTAVMVDEKLIGLAAEQREAANMRLVEIQEDMTPEILQEVFRVLILPGKPVQVLHQIGVVVIDGLADSDESPLKSGFCRGILGFCGRRRVHGILRDFTGSYEIRTASIRG